MNDISVIFGGIAKDNRGQIRFVNEFDMSLVKRFYIIKNADIDLIRGWRAHKIEQRWFYVLSGSFVINIIFIDNWGNPSNDLPIIKKTIKSLDNQVLHVPTGYAIAFQALEPNSELLVFADYDIEHAKDDDYIFPLEYFSLFK